MEFGNRPLTKSILITKYKQPQYHLANRALDERYRLEFFNLFEVTVGYVEQNNTQYNTN